MTGEGGRTEGVTGRKELSGLDVRDVVVLRSGFTSGDEFFLDAIQKRGVTADVSLRPVGWKPLRAMRRVHLMSKLPGKAVWFGAWLRKGARKRLIIVHAADLTLQAAFYAARRFPGARVVFWLWNPVGKGTDPERARQSGVEIWSFDQDDCREHRLSFNTQFAFSEISAIGERITPDVDLGFYGADKGRAEILSELAGRASELGLSCRFEVVPDRSSQLERLPLLAKGEKLPYRAVVEREAQARIMVDIVQDGQSGMTLRTLESLYLCRKLLTNLSSVRESALYDPTRVFLLGEDDLDELPAFLERESAAPSEELLEYYDFDSWLRRF